MTLSNIRKELILSSFVSMVSFYVAMVSTSGLKSPVVGQSVIKEYCQFQSFVGECADNEIVVITSGQYGRMRSGICIAGEGYVGCSADVTGRLESLCTGRRRCEVSVSSLAKDIQPCKKDFTSYLEAGHLCMKVATDNQRECHSRKFLLLDEQRGLLSSSTLLDESKAGSNTCPWRVKYKAGQEIQSVITVYHVAEHALVASKGASCPWILVFDRRGGASTSMQKIEKEALCGRLRMDKHLATSTHGDKERLGDKYLDIYLSWQGKLSDVPMFTLEYEGLVFKCHSKNFWTQIREKLSDHLEGIIFCQVSKVLGCPDEPPWRALKREEVSFKKIGDEMTVTCKASKEVFYLTCSAGKWLGEDNNCSSTKALLIPQKYGSTLGIPFPQGVIVAVVLGLILGLIIGSASLAILFMLRRRKRRSRNSGAASPVVPFQASFQDRQTPAGIHQHLHQHPHQHHHQHQHQHLLHHRSHLLPPPPPLSDPCFESKEEKQHLRSEYLASNRGICCGLSDQMARMKEDAPQPYREFLADPTKYGPLATYGDVQVRAKSNSIQCRFRCPESTEANGSTDRLLIIGEGGHSAAHEINKLSAGLPDCAVIVHDKTSTPRQPAVAFTHFDPQTFDKPLVPDFERIGCKSSDPLFASLSG